MSERESDKLLSADTRDLITNMGTRYNSWCESKGHQAGYQAIRSGNENIINPNEYRFSAENHAGSERLFPYARTGPDFSTQCR